MANICVSISNDNVPLREINESSGESLPDLIAALVSIKSQTNDYLTELVEAGKPQSAKETDPSTISGNGNDNTTRPTVLVVPEKKAKV